ncbi:MAG: demethoxyubiquinone hydroxylase family protein, partial [Alphaproteobacteria bacterium]|nr:demethoxyubiquinone hydroxylase family protein [Alphaproteobacteria bacterium]
PTALEPVWRAAGWALGAATAALGEKAAMACTVAVEAVIDRHYAEQLARLPAGESKLRKRIARFRAEEIAHGKTALDHGAEAAPGYGVLSAAIGAASRLAIALSTRI